MKRLPCTRVCGDTHAFHPVGRRLSLQRRRCRLPQSRGRPAAPGCAPELRQRTSESIITPGLGSGSRRCPCLSTDCPCQHHAAAGDLQTVPYSCKGLRRKELRRHASRLRLESGACQTCCPACKMAPQWHNDVTEISPALTKKLASLLNAPSKWTATRILDGRAAVSTVCILLAESSHSLA